VDIVSSRAWKGSVMESGVIAKRMQKLGKRLHKTMDNLPEMVEIDSSLSSIEVQIDSALASIEARAKEKLAQKRVGETRVEAEAKAEKAKKADEEARRADSEAREADSEAKAAAEAVKEVETAKGKSNASRKRNVRKAGGSSTKET